MKHFLPARFVSHYTPYSTASSKSIQLRTRLFLQLALLALFIIPALAIAQNVTRGPYLQTATPTSVIVRWRTDIATDSKVGFAVAGGIPSSISSGVATTEHAVTLPSLSADTLYNYTIGTTAQVLAGGDLNSDGDGEHFFTTPPLAGTDKPTRVWVIGDSGTANLNADAVREAYKTFTGARGTDVWLMLGDNAYDAGTQSEYQAAVFETYPQLLRQIPLWSAFGNHDAIDAFFNGPPGAYFELFSFPTAGEAGGLPSGTENYYSFDYGNIHFISIDSTTNPTRAVGSAMLTWLAADLAANTRGWTVAFWHHPEYSKGSHDSDAEVVLQEMRENVLPVLETGGVDLVLTGHSHSYERSVLVDGHYGLSGTLAPSMVLDSGDGNPTGDGAYIKPGPAGTPHEGAVHAVVGSSGKTSAAVPLNHPVMDTSILTLGSLVLDISGNQLDAAFINSVGTVLDEFSIIKSPAQVIEIDVDPWSTANVVKPLSDNPIAVAILGMSVTGGDAIDLDVTEVDPSTVKLGIAAAPNMALPWIFDFNADAEADVLLGFSTQAAGVFCDDTEITLVGETFSGDSFTGTDTIEAMDCADLGCHP